MASVRNFLLAGCLVTASLASPVLPVEINEEGDVVLNLQGKHNIIVNEYTTAPGMGSSCSGTVIDGSSPGGEIAGPYGSPSSHGMPNDGNRNAREQAAHPGYPTASHVPTVLTPGCAPDIDRSSLDHLLVRHQQDFYFHEPQKTVGQSTVATMKVPQLVHPAVQLQISTEIQQVTCTNNSINVDFRNKAAYEAAIENWTKTGTFIMVSYAEGCGSGYAKGEQDYLIVTNVSGDGSSNIKATIKITDFEGAVGRETVVTVDIATFNPSNGTNGFNVTNGNGSGSNNGTVPGPGPGPDGNRTTGLSTFDADLDASIGFVSIDDPDFANQFFPSLESAPLFVRDLEPRFLGKLGSVFNKIPKLPPLIDRARKEAEKLGTSVLGKVSQFLNDAKDEIEHRAMQALDGISRFTSVNRELSSTFGIDQRPSNADTRWGSAYQLYNGNGIRAYCVGCGVSGQVTLAGSLSFSIAQGFSSGKLKANGNLNGIAQLGVEADVNVDFAVPEQTIAQVALSDLALAGVLTIGPAIKLSAGADVGFKATGNLLAGVTLDWPAVSASIDIASAGGAQVDGWRPNVTPAFQAEGDLTARVEPYTKIALQMTLSLLQGKFEKSVALIDQPSIIAEANVAGKAGYDGGELSGEFTNGCAGVAVSGRLRNQLYVDLLGIERKNIFDWTSEPVSRCLGKSARRDLTGRQVGTINGGNGTNTNATESGKVQYSILSSLSGNLDLHAGQDGNLYAISSLDSKDPLGEDSAATTSLFESIGTTIIADSQGRIMHGYGDTLAEYGVSRIRFSQLSAIPRTARTIQLDPADHPTEDNSLGIMVARDTAADVYLLATCVYESLYPKVFLVKPDNVQAYLQKLTSGEANIVKRVTGPGVKSCGLVPYGNGVSKE